MAGWSMIDDDDESVLNCSKLLQHTLPELGFEDCGCDSEKTEKLHELRCLFNRFISIFLEKTCSGSSFRPLPPMLGDRKFVDLFRLFLVVREKGGYDSVLKNGSWASVAEESGFGSEEASALKLIYIKYLDVLERWLERVVRDNKKLGGESSGFGEDPGVFLMGLEAELKCFLSGIDDLKKKEEECPPLDLMDELNCTDVGELGNAGEVNGVVDLDGGVKSLDSGQDSNVTRRLNFRADCSGDDKELRDMKKPGVGKKCNDDTPHKKFTSELGIAGVRKLGSNDEVGIVLESDGVDKCLDHNEDVMISDVSVVTEEVICHKRKRGSMCGMLNWVIETAKNPCDPTIGAVPESSKWKSYGNQELWKQVLLVREALFLKRQGDLNVDQSSSQKKQKIRPSMYDDHIETGDRLTERLRCSQRLLSVKQPQAQGSPEISSSATQSDVDESPHPCMEGMEDGNSDPLMGDSAVDSFIDCRRQKRVPVGPLFQADVPEWMGVKSESDSKWLGTQIWPLEKGEKRLLVERIPIGKGRQDSCGCSIRGSVVCVRFHIAEKRMNVRLELGSAFYRWNFNKMGEDVILSWTTEEEKKFKTIIRSNPASLGMCFWDRMFRLFPSKSREALVSYYFNAFLLQRRGDQNRLTPNNIDSDDDESEVGSVTRGGGFESTNSRSSILYGYNSPCKNFR